MIHTNALELAHDPITLSLLLVGGSETDEFVHSIHCVLIGLPKMQTKRHMT